MDNNFIYYDYENNLYRKPADMDGPWITEVKGKDGWMPYPGDKLAPHFFGDIIENPGEDEFEEALHPRDKIGEFAEKGGGGGGGKADTIKYLSKSAENLNLSDPEDRAIFRQRLDSQTEHATLSALNEWSGVKTKSRHDGIRALAQFYMDNQKENAPKIKSMFDRIHAPDGGFTYNPVSDVEPDKGYALSIYPDRSFGKNVKDITIDDFHDFIVKNHDLLSDSKNNIGAWNDPATGHVFLDISMVTQDEKEAVDLCKQHDQIAYFDLSNFKSVTVNQEAKSGGAAVSSLKQYQDDVVKAEKDLDDMLDKRFDKDAKLDDFFKLSGNVVEVKKKFAKELIKIPDNDFLIQAKTTNGLTLSLNKSAQREGYYQTTRFDNKEEPFADSQYKTKEEAIKQFINDADVKTIKVGE